MHKRYPIIIILFHLCLLIYVLFRASLLSFVHDEGLSYAIIKGDQENAMTANDHYLNTFLMSLSCDIFGESEFMLRLPNIIAFGFYILGCARFLDKTKSVWLYIFGNTLLLLNPFVLDFFSLARRYGLSLALLIWS